LVQADNSVLDKFLNSCANFCPRRYSNNFFSLAFKGESLPALQLLVGLVGADLWQLNNEINKLVNYKRVGDMPVEITVEDVKKIVTGNFDDNVFALTDALSHKNKAAALKILEEQYDAGAAEEYLLTMFLRQFKILLQIKSALDSKYTPAKIASALKFHPFVIKKGIDQAKNFSSEQLKNIYNRLLENDYLNKTGQGNLKTLLNLFISEL
jgi:DNA polymerase-3 subunit delta